MVQAGDAWHVLLVGNYVRDEQASMQRFAKLMGDGLRARGVGVSEIAPAVRIGDWLPAVPGGAKWLGYVDKYAFFRTQLRQTIRSIGPGRCVVHICDHSNAPYVPWIRRLPHLVTCHDLLAVRRARGEFRHVRTRWSGRQLQDAIVRGLRRAGAIVCDSAATRADVLRLVMTDEAQVGMIHPCVSPAFKPTPRQAASRHAGAWLATGERYLLHVGGNQWYKNRAGLLAIYAALVQRMPEVPKLVIAGRALPADVTSLASRLGLSERVVELPNVSDVDLAALYSSAVVLLFPSIAEGFGWPVLEAMACGCRVVTTNEAPLTEIGADAATYLDPRDAARAAEVVFGVLQESDEERQTHIAAGLTRAAECGRDRMIDAYLQVYERVVRGEPLLLRANNAEPLVL